jgi:DNA-binding SARP family transcriptional activator
MSAVEFGLLDGLVVRDGGEAIDLGGPKQRAVLAVLLLEGGRPVPADRLTDLVWGDDPPARAETSLQSYVSNLRRVLEPDRLPRHDPRVLVTRPGGYALEVAPDAVDVWRFRDLAGRGHAQLAPGTADAAAVAAPTLDAALALWRGPLLPELADEHWVVEAAARLGEVRAQAIEDRADAGLLVGEEAMLVGFLADAVAAHPYRERFRAQLALTLYRCGRQREALAAIDEARAALAEVGLEPSRSLRQLQQDVLDQAPHLDAPDARPSVTTDAEATTTTSTTASTTATVTSGPAPATDGDRRARAFVGRDHELATLLDALAEASDGHGRPVVVSGEPGIGKTRLVEELAVRAGEAVVAWARCPESAAQAAYWPCIQIGRQLEAAGVVPPEVVADLLPDEDVLPDDPMADRIALLASAAKVLTSATRPLVVVVDDVQWADPASLRIIEFLAGELARTSTLLVVTVRPIGADGTEVSAPLIDCLGELARAPGAARIDLAGLDPQAVERWLAARGGVPDTAVADLVHDRTGGNPFFVGEVVELLAAEGRLTDLQAASRGTAVPAAVHDVVRRRVGRLAAGTQRLLTVASVIGRSFDIDVLGAVAGLAPGEVLDALDPALDSGLVTEHDKPGRFQFAHALVAEALTAELNAVRRARLHATTAAALLRLRGTELDDDVAALAHHTYEGAPAGIADEAYTWAVTAARLASTRLAHEDAAEQWLRAARAVEMARPLDVAARHEALVEAGLALLRVDAVAAAYEPLVEAMELALAAGDPEMIVAPAAAMNIEGLWMAGEIALTGVDVVGVLQRAVAALPPEHARGRALALGALAEAGYWVLGVDELDRLSLEALQIARTLGDHDLLARTLHKRIQAMWRASTFPERRDAVEELAAMVEVMPADTDRQALAWYSRASVSWEQGDVDLTLEQLTRGQELAARTGTPALVTQLGFMESVVCTARGEVQRAEHLVEDAYDLYRRTRRWAAEPFRSGHRLLGLVEMDRLDEVEALAPDLLVSDYGPVFAECVAFAFHELGAPERARAITPDIPDLPDAWLFLGAATGAAHNRVYLGDLDGARILGAQLAPYSGRFAVVGTGPALGDVDLALARIALLDGDREGALRLLDRSVDLLARGGAVPWLVRALLQRHDLTADPADLERAGAALATRHLPLLERRLSERQAASK